MGNMNYHDTWFGHLPMRVYGGRKNSGRRYWMRPSVSVFTGNLVSMFHKNADGSIDVLGAEILIMHGGGFGSFDKSALQRSLAEHADKIKELGATIVKQTKNYLKARHEKETLTIEIK